MHIITLKKDKVTNNQTLIKQIFTATQEIKTGKTTASLERDRTLREAQKNLIIKGLTFDDIVKQRSSMAVLHENDVSTKVKTTNTNLTKVKYINVNIVI